MKLLSLSWLAPAALLLSSLTLAAASVSPPAIASSHQPPQQHVFKRSNGPTPRWLTLPPTPKLPQPYRDGRVTRPDGTQIWYAQWYGQQDSGRGRKRAKELPPVVFLHGGLGAAQWLGKQIDEFRKTRNVIAIDSRGQGRSTFNGTIGYDLMTDDVVAVLDSLKVDKAAFVGWSDGAIIILDMMMRHPSYLERGFAFAANYDISGTYDVTTSPVFTSYLTLTEAIYKRINPKPDYAGLQDAIFAMWATQPNWVADDFTRVSDDVAKRVWIVDADHEEAVKITQLYDMSGWLGPKGAKTVILPAVSHFAFIQDEPFFNRAVEDMLYLQL